MTEHQVTRIRNQHGPKATCGVPQCGRAVQWDVMGDRWLHTYTVAQHQANQAQAVESIVELMRGLAASLQPLRAGAPSPDQVETYLRGRGPLPR